MREVIGMSKWHEEVLTNGLSLDLKDIPRRYREKNNVSALKNMEVLKEKVKEWEDDGYVEPLDGPAWCCNPMSVAAKYDPVKDETKLRPCIDLSWHVNKHTRVSHAKLDDLAVAQELVSRGDYMASFDLANQFFHVKLHQADKKFFGFEGWCFGILPVYGDGVWLQPCTGSCNPAPQASEGIPTSAGYQAVHLRR
jgi:hypothetical protein